MILNAKPIPFGIMAWWKGVEDAAAYHVSLFIDDDRIMRVETDRDTLCHSFTDLALISRERYRGSYVANGRNYYVKVEAEDRDGNVIDRSEAVACEVITFQNEVYFGRET